MIRVHSLYENEHLEILLGKDITIVSYEITSNTKSTVEAYSYGIEPQRKQVLTEKSSPNIIFISITIKYLI